jgi:FRG domain
MMTLDEFFQEISQAKSKLEVRRGEKCLLYRGQSNKWPLLPSLLRHPNESALERGKIHDLEATLFYEFQARARELHQRSLSGWDVLFFMRHHGVPTRILDWTEALGVALYFAVLGANDKATPCVWLLNPYALNENSFKVRDLVAPQFLTDNRGRVRDYSLFLLKKFPRTFGWNHPVALYPLQLSDRLHAQRGYFTIHGEDVRPLEKINPNVVSSVDIPVHLIEEIKTYLDRSGINTYLLFPDLDGLARYLQEKHGEKYGNSPSPHDSVYGK